MQNNDFWLLIDQATNRQQIGNQDKNDKNDSKRLDEY